MARKTTPRDVMRKIDANRIKKKISKREVSRRTGIDEKNVSEVLRHLCEPTLPTFLKIAEACEVKIKLEM